MGYIEYDKAYFSELSVQFNIAVNKVISLIESGDLKYGSQKCDSEIAVLLELARKYHASKSDLNQHELFLYTGCQQKFEKWYRNYTGSLW